MKIPKSKKLSLFKKLKIRWQILKQRWFDLDYDFRKKKVKLHIVAKDYAYLEIGCKRYYFHKSKTPVQYKWIKTLTGKRKRKSILPYDGWEIGC